MCKGAEQGAGLLGVLLVAWGRGFLLLAGTAFPKMVGILFLVTPGEVRTYLNPARSKMAHSGATVHRQGVSP